jgi:hypothetical protein
MNALGKKDVLFESSRSSGDELEAFDNVANDKAAHGSFILLQVY